MGLIPFFLFQFSKETLSEKILVSCSYPFAMHLGAKYLSSSVFQGIEKRLDRTTLFIYVLCSAVLLASLNMNSVLVGAIASATVGLLIGVYTVEIRALRAKVTDESNLSNLVAMQTLAGRFAAPVSGFFGSILIGDDISELAKYLGLGFLVTLGFGLFRFQSRYLREVLQKS
jgi:hypothetical protein